MRSQGRTRTVGWARGGPSATGSGNSDTAGLKVVEKLIFSKIILTLKKKTQNIQKGVKALR